MESEIKMQAKEIILDDEAQEIFEAFGGIDTNYRSVSGSVKSKQFDGGGRKEKSGDALQQLYANLEEEEKQLDQWRILLISFAHLISSYFLNAQSREGIKPEKDLFNKIARILAKLVKMPGHDSTIFIRLRGFPKNSEVSENIDFIITFGRIKVDVDIVPAIIKRSGIKMSHLAGQLTRAFEVFSDYRINNLYLKIPDQNSSLLQEQLWDCLRILARYNQALQAASPIVFNRNNRKVSLPIVFDEKNRLDINLTRLAGLNGLKDKAVSSLVQQVGLWIQKNNSTASDSYAGCYDAILNIKNLKGKLAPPPLEVNNVKWRILDRGQKTISKGKAMVGRTVMDNFGNSPEKTEQVMQGVYGNDYEKIDSRRFGQRVKVVTDLLNSVEKGPKGEKILEEIVESIQSRFDEVKDKVFEDIEVQKDRLKIRSGKNETTIKGVHSTLLDMVEKQKKSAGVMRKMKDLVDRPIGFNSQDVEVIANNFNISVKDAEDIIALLRSCFDSEGHFLKKPFEQNVPKFALYERKIFDLLWEYLKETPDSNDRVAFLNSLQLLIVQMKQPKRALRVLLSDLCDNPDTVNFSDKNAFMLANLFLRKYNKELNLDIEITPEEVLLVQAGLDQEVAQYTSWRIENNQEKFFAKLNTIRNKIFEALNSEGVQEPMSARYLISLEREVFIFLALVGGSVARSALRSAIQNYGNPDSEIYMLKESHNNSSVFLQHLRVILRGLGRIGKSKDLPLLEEIKNRKTIFTDLQDTQNYAELVSQVMMWVDRSIQKIISAS